MAGLRPLALRRTSDEVDEEPDVDMMPPVDLTEKFEINWASTIGEGAFSVVRECTEIATGEKFAAKLIDLRPLKLRRSFAIARVLREVSIMKSLSHENIVRLKAVYHTDSMLWLIQARCFGELANGGELFQAILRLGRFPENLARTVIRQVMSAIKYMHDQGIVHRDIKPENIMLSFRGHKLRSGLPSLTDTNAVVKLVDFGLAKMLGEDQSAAKTLLGTPQYIAPEVLLYSNSSRSYGFPVDCWSIGVVLYMLLSGRFPFESPHVASNTGSLDFDDYTERRIVTGQFEFEPAEWATVSNAAKHLVCQLLRVDPSARYTMAQALLHPWLTGEGGDDLDVIPVKPTYNESDVAKLQLFAGSRRSSFTSLSSDGSGNGPGGSSGISTSAAAGGGGVASMEREAEGKAAAADDASPASRASGVGHGGSYGGGGGGGGSGSAAAAGAGGSGGVQWAGAKLESQFRDSAVQSPVLSTPTMSRYPGFLAPLRTPRASDRGTDAEDAPIRDGAASSTVDLAGARSGSVATDASAASLLTFSTDRDGRVTYMSDVLLDRLGYSRAEVVGQPCSSFLSSASLDVLRMLKVAGSCLQTPFVLIRRNGEPWEFVMDAKSPRGADGTPLGFVFTMYAVEEAPEAMVNVLNASGCIVLASAEWLEWLGLDDEEAANVKQSVFLTPESAAHFDTVLIPAVSVTGSSASVELSFVAKSGRVRRASVEMLAKRGRKGAVSSFEVQITQLD